MGLEWGPFILAHRFKQKRKWGYKQYQIQTQQVRDTALDQRAQDDNLRIVTTGLISANARKQLGSSPREVTFSLLFRLPQPRRPLPIS